jgi:hypothetical protein
MRTQVNTEAPPVQVSIVERLTERTLSVNWSDARLGHHADQIWRISVARGDARCVLTGMSIRRGDAVFRPRLFGTTRPANSHWMILASAASDYLRNRTL